MDLVPQQANSSIPSTHQDQPNYGTYKNMRREGQRAQVTMIYEGKVFVFSDLSSEKAEQILLLAENDETSPQIYTQLNCLPAPTRPNQWSFLQIINQGSNFDVSIGHMTCGIVLVIQKQTRDFLVKISKTS
ncbi:unnamed protein product [Arabis nemorensis]|uniref:Tify domain-containing protein n=1 Tax=Arabis nemorensis TaxID=586526 RepID=A0A565CTP4_9BRAS|nr:unnamed protein product [Arabis nemorensis]